MDGDPRQAFAQTVALSTTFAIAPVRRVIRGLTCNAPFICVIARWSMDRARRRVIVAQLELARARTDMPAGPSRLGEW
jgi:hypothetical protein